MRAYGARSDVKFLEAYLQGKDLADCVKYSGSKAKTRDSLRVIAYEKLQRLGIGFREICETKGITDVKIAEKLWENSDATKPVVAIWEGKITDVLNTPDTQARNKSLELLMKAKGTLTEKVELSGPSGGDLTLQLTPTQRKGKGKKELTFE